MKVKELMTESVESCRPETNLAAASMIMWWRDCGFVPVVDHHGILVGVLTDRDICIATATRHSAPESLRAADVMTKAIFSIGPESDVREALETMRTQRVRRLPVIDAAGHPKGILSINDLVLAAGPMTIRSKPDLTADAVLLMLQGICARRATANAPLPSEALTPG